VADRPSQQARDYQIGRVIRTGLQLTKGTPAEPWVRAGLGMAGYGIGAKLENALSAKAAIAAAPATEALQTAKDAAYADARNAGVVVNQSAFKNGVQQIQDAANAELIDKGIHPQATAVLNRLQSEVGTSPSLSKIDQFRRLIGDVAGSPNPSESRMGMAMKSSMDDWWNSLRDSDAAALSGTKDVPAAVSAWKDARALNTRFAKSQIIEQMFQRAALSPDNYEGTLKGEFKTLAKKLIKNPQGFTRNEQAVINDVSKGSVTGFTLRQIGKRRRRSLGAMSFSPEEGAAGSIWVWSLISKPPHRVHRPCIWRELRSFVAPTRSIQVDYYGFRALEDG
jgi:hypothetical protein